VARVAEKQAAQFIFSKNLDESRDAKLEKSASQA